MQGFSSVLPESPWRLPGHGGNGFGAKENSSDFVLRIYRIDPQFQDTDPGGPGTIDGRRSSPCTTRIARSTSSSSLTARSTRERYSGGSGHPRQTLADRRRLRHRVGPVGRDGTLWFGDEFGPFLLHTELAGQSARAPFACPASSRRRTVPERRHAESRAQQGLRRDGCSCSGRTSVPDARRPAHDDPDQQRLTIYAFDTKTRRYTGTGGTTAWKPPSSTGQRSATSRDQRPHLSRHRARQQRRGLRRNSRRFFPSISDVDADRLSHQAGSRQPAQYQGPTPPCRVRPGFPVPVSDHRERHLSTATGWAC